jgi:hypothetical protein
VAGHLREHDEPNGSDHQAGDEHRHCYDHIRPHWALGRRTPLQAYSERSKAPPAGNAAGTHFRVREHKVDETGGVSLRYDKRRADPRADARSRPPRLYALLGHSSSVHDVLRHLSGMS